MCGLLEGRLGSGEGHHHLLGPHQLAVLAARPTCGVLEWLEDASSPPDVSPVEVQHAQETHQLGLGGWLWVGLNGRHTCVQRVDALR